MKITLYEKTFDNELVHNSLVVNFCYAFFTHIFSSVFLSAVREVTLFTFNFFSCGPKTTERPQPTSWRSARKLVISLQSFFDFLPRVTQFGRHFLNAAAAPAAHQLAAIQSSANFPSSFRRVVAIFFTFLAGFVFVSFFWTEERGRYVIVSHMWYIVLLV